MRPRGRRRDRGDDGGASLTITAEDLGKPAPAPAAAPADALDGVARVARWLVVAVFVVSGAAGLIYEVVWSRQLVLVFGNTTQAVSAILTGFFGGMALGNALGGRLADRVARPLRLYGVLELIVAAVALATPVMFRATLEVYRGGYGWLQTQQELFGLLRFALALLALGPATILMGATLPTLTRHLARGSAGLSGSFARLYAANTLGAVLGAAVSGFVLIELLGLNGALQIGVACSALAGMLALVIDALVPSGRPEPEPGPRTAGSGPAHGSRPAAGSRPPAGSRPIASRALAPSRLRLGLGFAFVSGLTALGYQTLWTRLLASGTGNSTYVFAVILVVFLAGLTGGALLFDVTRRWIRNPLGTLALCQVVVAVLAILGLANVISGPPLVNVQLGDVNVILAKLWPATIAVVLPPTLVMGFSLPLASALLGATDETVGSRTGLLLAVNTLGSIAGTFAIPFFVIPFLGSPHSVALLAIANVATAFVLVWRAGDAASPIAGVPPRAATRRSATRALAGGAAVFGSIVIAAALLTPRVMTDPGAARVLAMGGTVYASAEDEIASVQAGSIGSRYLWVTGTSMTALTVDTRLMPDLSLALRPGSSRSLVIAFGMGSAYRSSLIAGLRTDAVELVPTVPGMFHWFFPDAAAYLADPRGRVIVADGRNYVELTTERYDIIVVDPPPPTYSSGVSVIASLEFYRAAQRRLTPGGVMMEWMPFASPTPEFRAEVRTFTTVFPHVLLLRSPGGFGTYMFGSDQPLDLSVAALRAMLSRPGVLADISSAADAPTKTAEGWLSLLPGLVTARDGEAAIYAGAGPLITDDRPLPEYFLLGGTAAGR